MAVFSRLGCTRDGPWCAARLVFISTGPRCRSADGQRHCRIYLHVSLPAVILSLATDLFLRGLLVESGGCDPWISWGRCCSYFREGSGYIPLSPHHTYESVPDYFPELSKVEPIVGKWVGAPEPSVWVCQKLGGCFYGSPMRGKHQFGSQESEWNGCALKPISDIPSLPTLLSPQQALRCRVGWTGLQRVGWEVTHRVG